MSAGKIVKPASAELIHLTVLRTERLSAGWMRVTFGGGDIDAQATHDQGDLHPSAGAIQQGERFRAGNVKLTKQNPGGPVPQFGVCRPQINHQIAPDLAKLPAPA